MRELIGWSEGRLPKAGTRTTTRVAQALKLYRRLYGPTPATLLAKRLAVSGRLDTRIRAMSRAELAVYYAAVQRIRLEAP